MTHKIRYVVLNGPPGSGKSTMAKEICSDLNNSCIPGNYAVTDSLAAPIKHFFAAALGRSYDTFNKEIANVELNGYSIRQALIALAEDHCKAMYGEDCFARWLVHRSLHHPKWKPYYYIIDDGGFNVEIDAVPNKLVIRVDREGKTFKGDSREYYATPDIIWENKGPLPGLWRGAKELAEKIKAHGWA